MITLLLTSPPDRKSVVVELWRANVQLAEVTNENGQLRLEVYASPGTVRVEVGLDELEAALRKAREELTR